MPPKTSGRRAQARAEMEEAILTAGRRQLAERGAAALSLREIARSIGVVSSAVYRYVDSRDALLTLLVADAYTQLADAVEQALDAPAPRDAAGQLGALAHAMRDWAVAHPEQWGLVYGAPVPGYEAPRDRTTGPGTRVMARLVSIAAAVQPADAHAGGAARLTAAGLSTTEPKATTIPSELATFLELGNHDLRQTASPPQGLFAVRAWCTIVGTISMEVFGQLGPELQANPAIGPAVLDAQLSALTAQAAVSLSLRGSLGSP